MSWILRVLAKSIYPVIAPFPGADGSQAERFLLDRWRFGPIWFALGQTFALLFICVSPLFFAKRLALFPYLKSEEQELLLQQLMQSKSYSVRSLALAVRSSAILAMYPSERNHG